MQAALRARQQQDAAASALRAQQEAAAAAQVAMAEQLKRAQDELTKLQYQAALAAAIKLEREDAAQKIKEAEQRQQEKYEAQLAEQKAAREALQQEVALSRETQILALSKERESMQATQTYILAASSTISFGGTILCILNCTYYFCCAGSTVNAMKDGSAPIVPARPSYASPPRLALMNEAGQLDRIPINENWHCRADGCGHNNVGSAKFCGECGNRK